MWIGAAHFQNIEELGFNPYFQICMKERPVNAGSQVFNKVFILINVKICIFGNAFFLNAAELHSLMQHSLIFDNFFKLI